MNLFAIENLSPSSKSLKSNCYDNSVYWRFPRFLQISAGWWPKDINIAEYYHFKEHFDLTDVIVSSGVENSKSVARKKFQILLESVIAPRAVIWQIVPGLTFLSQYTILTCGNPLSYPKLDLGDSGSSFRPWMADWDEVKATVWGRSLFYRCYTDEHFDSLQMQWTIEFITVSAFFAECRFGVTLPHSHAISLYRYVTHSSILFKITLLI